MSYAIRAWRDSTGARGITIGVLTASGYDNLVAELDISEDEFRAFAGECQAAMNRATTGTGLLREQLPGPYESWTRDS